MCLDGIAARAEIDAAPRKIEMDEPLIASARRNNHLLQSSAWAAQIQLPGPFALTRPEKSAPVVEPLRHRRVEIDPGGIAFCQKWRCGTRHRIDSEKREFSLVASLDADRQTPGLMPV